MLSCKKLEDDQPNKSFNAQDAKMWYTQNQPEHPRFLPPQTEKGPSVTIKNAWDQAMVRQRNGLTVVEVPLLSLGQFGFTTCKLNLNDLEANERLLGSLSRLVIVRNKRGAVDCRLMTLVPDSAYLVDAKHNLSKNGYLSISNDYSGMVLFHYPSGEFTNGWYYSNGTITKRISLGTSNSIPSSSKDAMLDCSYTTYTVYQRDCKDWTQNNGFSFTLCGNWYVYSESTVKTCLSADDVGGGGGTFEEPEYLNPIDENSDNPCEQMRLAATAADFKNAITNLLAKTSTKPEVGFKLNLNSDYTPGSGIYSYTDITGNINDEIPNIDIWKYLTPGETIDGFMHTHYVGLDPMFTADDIAIAYELYLYGRVNDLSTFTIGVVTSTGTYFVKIDDIDAFANFYNNKLDTEDKRDAINDSINQWWKLSGDIEKGFLKNFANSGVKLFKRETDGTIKPKGLNTSGTVVTINCN